MKMFYAKQCFDVIIVIIIIMTSQKTSRLRKDNEIYCFYH